MQGGWARYAHLFTKYYQSSNLWRPPKLKNREWMFIPFGNRPPIRHQGFTSLDSVRDFVTKTPSHSCFYSTAYWHRPYERKMADKDWIGADLIFDLDGDHLPGVKDNDFPNMMEKIQEQAYSLWNDFLVPDFGFKEKFAQLTFSGHRGFHIHYRDPDLIHLSSDARRELVSHIRGEGVDVQSTLLKSEVGELNGWQKRLESGLDDLLNKLQQTNPSAKPATVYRALDFLIKNGFIHKVASLNAFVGCSHPLKHKECYFLICDDCKNISECCDPNITAAIQTTTAQNQFSAKNTTLEISGHCNECLNRSE